MRITTARQLGALVRDRPKVFGRMLDDLVGRTPSTDTSGRPTAISLIASGSVSTWSGRVGLEAFRSRWQPPPQPRGDPCHSQMRRIGLRRRHADAPRLSAKARRFIHSHLGNVGTMQGGLGSINLARWSIPIT
jgi:hypothetical protein